MRIAVEIPAQTLADTLCAAVENNHMTAAWCGGLVPAGKTEKVKPYWYYSAAAFEAGILFYCLEKDDDATDGIITHRVDDAKVRAGLRLMAEKSPRHFADMRSGEGDAITADVFLQCVALGEVRYG